ncbi:hypothetical protein OC835_003305 [Tilletia horrida]|nr:hypothetical protein OC835_003305 [Tilletia horrida]
MDITSSPALHAIIELVNLAGLMVGAFPHLQTRYNAAYQCLTTGVGHATEKWPSSSDFSAAPAQKNVTQHHHIQQQADPHSADQQTAQTETPAQFDFVLPPPPVAQVQPPPHLRTKSGHQFVTEQTCERLLHAMKGQYTGKWYRVLQPRDDQPRQAQPAFEDAFSRRVVKIMRKHEHTIVHISRLSRALLNAATKSTAAAQDLWPYVKIRNGKLVNDGVAYKVVQAVSKFVFLGIAFADHTDVDEESAITPAYRDLGPTIFLADNDCPYFSTAQATLFNSAKLDKGPNKNSDQIGHHSFGISPSRAAAHSIDPVSRGTLRPSLHSSFDALTTTHYPYPASSTHANGLACQSPAAISPLFCPSSTLIHLDDGFVLSHAGSQGYSHTYTAEVYDASGRAYEITVSQWARTKPDDGLYIFTNVPFATSNQRADIGDSNSTRNIPPEIDGSDADSPSVEECNASFNGIGVLKDVADDKKSGTIVGLTFINKETGWLPWEVKLNFEDATRWENWTFPPVRSLVTFEAIIDEQEAEGPLKGIIRRLSYIMDAPRNLLQALGIGFGGTTFSDKRSKLRGINASKRSRDQDHEASSSGSSSFGSPTKSENGSSIGPAAAVAPPTTPASASDTKDKGKDKTIEHGTPPSPTLPTPRSKRNRSD